MERFGWRISRQKAVGSRGRRNHQPAASCHFPPLLLYPAFRLSRFALLLFKLRYSPGDVRLFGVFLDPAQSFYRLIELV